MELKKEAAFIVSMMSNFNKRINIYYTATNLFLFNYNMLTNLGIERIFVVKPVNRRQFGNQDMYGMILK
jgi:hypothetical protein